MPRRGNPGANTAAKKAAMKKKLTGGSVKQINERIKKATAVKKTTSAAKRTAAAKDRIYSHLPKRSR